MPNDLTGKDMTMKTHTTIICLTILIPSIANAYVSPEILEIANQEKNATIKAETQYLQEKGIKESLIDKAVELDNQDILLEDEIAIKWFYLKKYGNKDCFETMPFEYSAKTNGPSSPGRVPHPLRATCLS